jgi:OPT family oligopeptide transporter
MLAERADAPQNFTVRGVVVGLVIGIVICFSNIYFGLQTGWISGMSMPSALIGFGFFRAISSKLTLPFSPVENVLIQTVASSVGTMPLGCGFVGVMPALEYLLTAEENGPLRLGIGKLMLWAVGICLFGVVFAVPLRKQVIIREQLKFPTGSATALMIGVLHGEKEGATIIEQDEGDVRQRKSRNSNEEYQPLTKPDGSPDDDQETDETHRASHSYAEDDDGKHDKGDWKGQIRLLTFAFVGSSLYTVTTYFIPQIRNLPIFGLPAASTWLWSLNPSPAYVGQGIIMGPTTTAHMLLGAIIGWGILSPMAKSEGWAPGPVDDWAKGSKGWIVWVSLAIMLADALVSLGWLALRPTIYYSQKYGPDLYRMAKNGQWSDMIRYLNPSTSTRSKSRGYSALPGTSTANPSTESPPPPELVDVEEIDAPASHLVSGRVLLISAVISVAIYFASLHLTFPKILPFTATFAALLLALLLSLMGVRALGETDLNPVSGISKLTQLVFALIIPASNPNGIIINLLAGAISESGALQAGDLLQDLKTGHLLGAAPKAQFYGQLIGSVVGAVVSAAVYKLYTHVYTVPGPQFQVPTAYVWVFTARLVTGEGLPPHSALWAGGFAIVFAVFTIIRTRLTILRMRGEPEKWYAPLIPGGIAVAVGMYNTPNFTLARVAGGAIAWYWVRWRGKQETGVVVLASGLILGEGLCSIANLALAAMGVPHL